MWVTLIFKILEILLPVFKKGVASALRNGEITEEQRKMIYKQITFLNTSFNEMVQVKSDTEEAIDRLNTPKS